MSTSPTPDSSALSAAVDLFWERGYVATSLGALLERMKVSRKRIYSSYGSKEALFRAALESYAKEQAGPRMACLQGEGKGLGAIETYLQSWKFSPEFRGCLFWNSMAESENLTPDAMQIVRSYFTQLEGALVENLVCAQNRGEIQSDASTRSMAQQVLSTAMGLSLMGKIVSDERASSRTVRSLISGLQATNLPERPATAC